MESGERAVMADPSRQQRRRVSEDASSAGGATSSAAEHLQKAAQTQSCLEAINDEVAAEVLKLEAAANARRQPLYADRARALSSVPRFWGAALLGHQTLANLATQRDEAILMHLQELQIEDAANISDGYTISLTFGTNPYFSNRTVEKRIRCASASPLPSRANAVVCCCALRRA